jgi:uncharacterized membrane protein YidH (DUF202 family)
VPPDDQEDSDPGLARERTRLAWSRTAIAFGAVGAVMLRQDLVAGLIVMAMAPLVWWLGRFASRAPEPEAGPRRLLLVVVTVAVTAVSLLAILVALLSHSPGSLDQLLPRHG